MDDVPKAVKDWPDLNFVIYHAALRPILELPEAEAAEFEKSGDIKWVSDLASISQKHGVKNVYAEIGTAFGSVVVTNPRPAAGMMGTLIKGMGVDHVVWGTDSVWYGSPQWQIEALRRLEIPDDLQQKFGFAPLGPADGENKNSIFWDNVAKFYGLQKRADYTKPVAPDAIDRMKQEYSKAGIGRSNAAYGYVRRPVV